MTRPAEPTRTRPGECECGEQLWVMVLDDRVPPDGTDAEACMACGQVRVVHVYWDAETVRGYADADVPADVLEWVGAWPRVLPLGPFEYDLRLTMSEESKRRAGLDKERPFFLPASARAATLDELLALEDDARVAQLPLSGLRRLHLAGPPSTPPPDALPASLETFARAWWLLTSSDEEVAARLGEETEDPVGYVRLLAYEAACRQRDAERLAGAIADGGTARDDALREVASAGVRRTTFRSSPVRLAGPPPGLLPVVQALPPSPLRDEALTALQAVAV
jgi:hypothetical protein